MASTQNAYDGGRVMVAASSAAHPQTASALEEPTWAGEFAAGGQPARREPG
jgi:hypothetical protein